MASQTSIYTHIVYTDPGTGRERVLQSLEGRHDLPRGTLVREDGGYAFQVVYSEVVLGAPAILKVHVE